ncbi:hypothetical protein GWI33_019562 [Rhynchophorus ferrugineus]|uniref:Uncharacterized protein n=1 Tax=Rhynchophorus ferrugineus TaxID=354439 RepID=A0A834M437_RHYFE|nr:hypothetical protein GWI33_019562 [Rhynchophorus ferrugineus]
MSSASKSMKESRIINVSNKTFDIEDKGIRGQNHEDYLLQYEKFSLFDITTNKISPRSLCENYHNGQSKNVMVSLLDHLTSLKLDEEPKISTKRIMNEIERLERQTKDLDNLLEIQFCY